VGGDGEWAAHQVVDRAEEQGPPRSLSPSNRCQHHHRRCEVPLVGAGGALVHHPSARLASLASVASVAWAAAATRAAEVVAAVPSEVAAWMVAWPQDASCLAPWHGW